jgi:hypothetical protein
MKAIDPRKTVEYVPMCDRALTPEEQTVFVLKALTVSDEDAIRDSLFVANGDGDHIASLANQQTTALHVGIADVKNFEVPFARKTKTVIGQGQVPVIGAFGVQEIEEQFLIRIPLKVRAEVAQVILKSMNPSDEDLKN